MFVLHSYWLMRVQIYIIVGIGGAFYNEYDERYKELTTPMNISNASSVTCITFLPMNITETSSGNYTTSPTVDANYIPSGQTLYAIVCTLLGYMC